MIKAMAYDPTFLDLSRAERTNAIVLHLSQEFSDPAARAGKWGAGQHTGYFGPIILAIASSAAFPPLLDRARQELINGWRCAPGEPAPPDQLVLLTCRAGRHRSVAFLYLLAYCLQQVQGVEVDWRTPDCVHCGCPTSCRHMHGWWGPQSWIRDEELLATHVEALGHAHERALQTWAELQRSSRLVLG